MEKDNGTCLGCCRADEFGIITAHGKDWEEYCLVCFRNTDDLEDPDLFNVNHYE